MVDPTRAGVDGRPAGPVMLSEAPTVLPSHIRSWRFPSTAVSLRSMRAELRAFFRECALPTPEAEDLILAACEAAANGVEHARLPTEPFFDVAAEVDGGRVRVEIRDYGRWTLRPADPGSRGRGLQMMSLLATLSLTSGPRGTTVTLRNLVDGDLPS